MSPCCPLEASQGRRAFYQILLGEASRDKWDPEIKELFRNALNSEKVYYERISSWHYQMCLDSGTKERNRT